MEAFKGCKNLENVYCYAFLTPAIGSDIFKDCYVEYSSLYVLDESLNLYRNTEPWSNFGSIKGMSERPYKVSYYLDDELYKKQTYKQGDNIIPEENPTKEGHTFSGWSEIPSTMPAHDVEINGSFEVNTYKVSYFVENDLVHVDEVEFGKAFDLWTYVPEGDDITFNGWIGELYDTMPAHDITYRADITSGIAYIYNNAENISGIFTLGGRKVEKMDKGVYIVKMKNGNTRKVVNK